MNIYKTIQYIIYSTREYTISSRLLTYSSSLSLISAQFLDAYLIEVCDT